MTTRPSFTKLALEIFRAYITDGVPSSGAQKPVKADVRAWGLKIEASLDDLYDKVTSLLTVGGTVDVITATASPTVDALLAGQWYVFVPTGANTVIGPTINIDTLGAKTLTDPSGRQLPVGRLQNRATLGYYDGTVIRVMGGLVPFAKGHLHGLIPANNIGTPNTKIDIGAGRCRSDDDSADLMYGATFTKDLTATWVVGSGNGGLDVGVLAVSTSYDIYAIAKTDGSAYDFIVCKTSLGFTFPTGYTVKRLVGQFMTDGAAAIRPATWFSDGSATLAVPVSDVAVTNPGTAAVLRTLSAPLSSVAIFTAWLNNATTAAVQLLLTDPAQTDTTPSATIFDLRGTVANQSPSAEFRRKLNSSGQVRSRQQASGASDAFNIITRGWITDRNIH